MNKTGKLFAECVVEHRMLDDGDHVLVGLSGGKDSWALLGLLTDLQPKAPVKFTISAVTIDGGLVGLDPKELEAGCARLKVPFHLVRQSIFETVAEKKDEGSTFCSMCAKLRRGALYTFAEKIGASKLALGHHLDDALETLLLNLFYGGKMAALPPVLLSHSGHVPIIRPLLYCTEEDLRSYAASREFQAIGCACPVCPTHPEYEFSDLKRHEMKKWITQLSMNIPHLRETARSALRTLRPNRFLDPIYTEKIEKLLTRESFPSGSDSLKVAVRETLSR
jgi:tRNA 2-thiocytidine biosynthesis protein TtcA